MPDSTSGPGRIADAVILDIGETVLDRTREYAAWAQFFDVPAHTFSAVFGAMIARGRKVAEVIEYFGATTGVAGGRGERSAGGRSTSGPSYPELLTARRAAGLDVGITEDDLYTDVRPTLAALAARGIVVGIAGNQPSSTSDRLRALDLGAAFIASSTDWGIAKPHPDFFRRAAAEAGASPERTVYVGDQLRNDVVAPLDAGLRAVRIRRGPWGLIEHDEAVEASCLAVVDSLAELPRLLEGAAESAPEA
ncbi:HAD family hydrolase [Planctomonas sp. JC2975]|uniref:HAD family hydrolase n=1 Tax=Planctomonas sp. JC2975 TaxID=2729626 RepID=UPI001474C983|nr:HAD family hydrolase [Planctomonas sp. JC2975]NNC12304.1 HAD family hydrolase [Planctomonas sp. JC2975]